MSDQKPGAHVPSEWIRMVERLADDLDAANCSLRGMIDDDMAEPDEERELCDCTDELVVLARQLLGSATSEDDAPGDEAGKGYGALWGWFGLAYASWLTLPRVLMHEMPDQWQSDMARLLTEWDAAWNTRDLPASVVSAKAGGKFTAWPEWLLEYRHPDQAQIAARRAQQGGGE